MKQIGLQIGILFLFFSCNLEKEIKLKLPVYESSPVVECYIEPGKPFLLNLTESVSYFAAPQLPIIENALVVISYLGNNDTLYFTPGMDSSSKYLYTYKSKTICPFVYGTTFKLYVKDSLGRELFSEAKLLQPIKTDTLKYAFSGNNTYTLLSWNDNPNEENFFRIIAYKDSIYGNRKQNSFLSDEIRNGTKITISSRPRYLLNDSVFIVLYNIEKEYYNFLSSAVDAADANGNPFAQPGKVSTNIKGGKGIFATLSTTYLRVDIK